MSPRPGGQHAQLHRKIVINEGDHEETGGLILCAWEDCPRPGYSLYVVRVNYGSPGHPYVTRYAFCSERHMAYWVNASRHDEQKGFNGQLPAGMRNLSLPR